MKKIEKIVFKNLNKLAKANHILFKAISQVTSELHKKWYYDRLLKAVGPYLEEIKSASPLIFQADKITLPKGLSKHCAYTIINYDYVIDNEANYEGEFFLCAKDAWIDASGKASKNFKIKISIPISGIKVINGKIEIKQPYEIIPEMQNPLSIAQMIDDLVYTVLPDSGLLTEIPGNDLRSMMLEFIERRNSLMSDLENLKEEIINERKKINSLIISAIESGIASARSAGAIKIQLSQNSVSSFISNSSLDSKYLNDLWDRLIYDPNQTWLGLGGSPSAINCTAGIEALRQAVEQKFFERLSQTPCDQVTDQMITNLWKQIAEEMARSDRFANWTDCD